MEKWTEEERCSHTPELSPTLLTRGSQYSEINVVTLCEHGQAAGSRQPGSSCLYTGLHIPAAAGREHISFRLAPLGEMLVLKTQEKAMCSPWLSFLSLSVHRVHERVSVWPKHTCLRATEIASGVLQICFCIEGREGIPPG